ncbi:GntR family transcriptional regulator [Streptosporangium roseum]|uniref:Transcriptional regulator, GntR family n=1 Tax=Streptosporangium roseum (strain ATCC 12428 / DSM 43021 / JCM 3005 / KCTC 9067 / NCIMB 10171 / NRRL 2505 / NI 9100) TaxID=479432 RepID=D2AUG7_STRRD|nr:GntR family transcriptional regulator [Streptosporangium roseum]ACZ84829.1 putative transcriptional regulator, GntR family [Streptosporangium roseum DSM 43021]
MTVDQLNPEPLWEQLAEILRQRIRAGELKPRQVLPSESHLQDEHGVSRGTVRRAMQALGKQGWTVTIQGRGTYVAERDSWPAE